MRAILGAGLTAMLVATAAAGVRADDEPKFDANKLVGKWEPAELKKGARAVMEFKKGGRLQIVVSLDEKDLPLDGRWELKGADLDVKIGPEGKEKASPFKLKKLDDTTLEYTDADGKAYTLKRVKG